MRQLRILLLLCLLLLWGHECFAENVYSVETNEKDGERVSTLIVKDSKTGKKFRGPSDYSVSIETIRDFDNDGKRDALVATHGGGNCCPAEYHVVTLKNGRLIVADMETDFSIKQVKKDGGRWYVVDQKTDHAYYYSFIGGKLVLSKTVKGLAAIREVRGPGGAFRDEESPRVLVYDIDGDGEDEETVCAVWTRWGSLLCELPLPDGESQALHTGCMRFGVLASTSHGYHEFVCDFDTVVTFNGKRWVNKKFPDKGDY